MSALICDICGGNLVMDETGEFAKCESCGMKHSKERVKAKVQEIKGVVEITKGEAEKERLLKNAETYLQLNEKLRAEEIYKKVTNEYPDEWRGWFGLLKLQFEILQKVFEDENDYQIKDYERKCIKLNPQSHEEIERIYEKYGYKNYYAKPKECFEYFKEKIEKGELCFFELGLKGNRRKDIPNETLEKITELLKNNANKINEELRAKGKLYKLINIFNMKKEMSGIDNRPRMRDSYSYDKYHKLSEVVELEFLSSREAIYKGKYENKCERTEYIVFPNRLSIEELLEELMKPTYEEQRDIWRNAHLCELCGNTLDKAGVCSTCGCIVDEKLFVNKCNELLELCYIAGNFVELFTEIWQKFDGETTRSGTITRGYYHFEIKYRKNDRNTEKTKILFSLISTYEPVSKKGNICVKIPNNMTDKNALDYGIYRSYTAKIEAKCVEEVIEYLKENKMSVFWRFIHKYI